jgi:3,4-dihydroxy-2-butanone 4-phosphate synthase
LAERIEAFTLERLESLAMQPARLVLGAQLAHHWDLRSGQTIDAKRGIYDGHSAADRARTMRVAASGAPSSALSSPGKVVIETAINDASRLCLEFATSGGRRPALAVAALCTDDGRYVTADEVARDRRLSHLALGVASADISPVAANGSVGNGDGQARGHDCQSLTQGATVGGQHRC